MQFYVFFALVYVFVYLAINMLITRTHTDFQLVAGFEGGVGKRKKSYPYNTC